MTRKEWVEKNMPSMVNPMSEGGVDWCPFSYSYRDMHKLDASIVINGCLYPSAGNEGCTKCWNTELPEKAEAKPEKETGSRWTVNPKIHPDHYNNSKISPFDVWDDWKLDPYTATSLKYIKRAGSKAGESAIDDLEKAADYILERVKRLKEEQNNG